MVGSTGGAASLGRRATIGPALALAGSLLVLVSGCAPDREPAGLDELRQPTGLALAGEGRWLFVTNGNWDLERLESSIVAIDLDELEEARAAAAAPGTALDGDQPCRRVAGDDRRVECRPEALIDPRSTVRLPSGAGNIAVDRRLEASGTVRLLVPTRLETGLWWADVSGLDADFPTIDCGQGETRDCAPDHAIPDIPAEPARVVIDDQGYPYAYLPHLLGQRLSLLRLGGARGPELAGVSQEFFQLDPIFDQRLGGGFSTATRPCDPARAPVSTVGCRRPLVYASQRFWAGLRTFRVAPGLDLALPGAPLAVAGSAAAAGAPRPLTGDLRFVDPEVGDRLLVVHTTPPALSVVDTSLGEDGEPVDRLLRSVPLCGNPNLLELYRPDDAPQLVFVSCTGQDRVQVLELERLEVVASIAVGAGVNELAVDPLRRRLYAASTERSSISVIELDRNSVDYLREIVVIGRGAGRRGP